MALPQYHVKDSDGNEIGVYERRADAEAAIQTHLQRQASRYLIDDSEYRAKEAAEFAAIAELERVREAEAVLAAHEEQDRARDEARAVINAADAAGSEN